MCFLIILIRELTQGQFTISSSSPHSDTPQSSLSIIFLIKHLQTANCSSIPPLTNLNLTFFNSKAPTQTQKLKTLQKLILSYFHNIIHMLSQLTDKDMLQLAVTESAKLIPYIISSRKAVKLYLKVCACTTRCSSYSLLTAFIYLEMLRIVVKCPG